jgi:hypothetical protein
MIRVLLAATALLVCSAAADAAARHRPHARAKPAPVHTPQKQIYPNRPAWAPAGACYTDEGYGRFLPCGMGGRDI